MFKFKCLPVLYVLTGHFLHSNCLFCKFNDRKLPEGQSVSHLISNVGVFDKDTYGQDILDTVQSYVQKVIGINLSNNYETEKDIYDSDVSISDTCAV